MKISFITLTNDGYLDYTLNCLESLKRINSPILPTCYCVGKKCFDKLTSLGYNCVYYDNNELSKISEFQTFKNSNWSKITYIKLEVIYKELFENDYVLYTDGDIVFENNGFLDHLIEISKNNYDILFQNDSRIYTLKNYVCSGFMFIKSSSKILNIFDPKNMTSYKTDNTWDDQTYLNSVKDKYTYYVLPFELFPTGKYYYEKHKLINPMIIHFNWVVGHKKKEKMKAHKKWYIKE